MLQGKGLLTSLQRRFLTAFATLPDQDWFYLAGGTALAEFYLVALNRVSEFPDQVERWPVKMLMPFDPVQLKHQFQTMALKLMAGLV